MTFDQVLEILQYALPIIVALLGAKLINQNSLPWHLWNGRVAKLLGLLISVTDALRNPKKYAKDVAPDTIKKKVDKAKHLSLLIPFILFPLGQGCAGFQFGGATWQETAHNNINNVAKVTGQLEQHGMPVWSEVCTELAQSCLESGDGECKSAHDCIDAGNLALDIFAEIDDYLRLAAVAVELGDEDDFDSKFAKASELMREVVRKLGKYGAL